MDDGSIRVAGADREGNPTCELDMACSCPFYYLDLSAYV
jgi:hypothetical protein